MTGIHVFDTSVGESNLWIKEVMEKLSVDDPHVAHAAIRAVLHALRDRISPESAVHLGAQLPLVIRGLYYEGWRLAATQTKERHMEQFLDHIGKAIPQGVALDPDRAARAVCEILCEKIDYGEIAKLISLFPLELRDIWPVLAQVEAAER